MDTARIIRARRQEAATSIRELAAMANVSPSYLSRIEAGQSIPTTDMATKLLEMVGYTIGVQPAPQIAPIAATRKACDPTWDGTWDAAAEAWLNRYQRAGWVDGVGSVKPNKRPDLLIRTGLTSCVYNRPTGMCFTPAEPTATWLDVVERLAQADIDYALTGGPAANQIINMGGGLDAIVYVPDIDEAAEAAGLCQDPVGWAVLLPFNGVCEVGRFIQQQGCFADGVQLAAIDQVIIDCAGIPKRGLDQAQYLTGKRI